MTTYAKHDNDDDNNERDPKITCAPVVIAVLWISVLGV